MDFDPISGNQDEEYIELTNPNTVAVDISGWQFTGGVDYTFAPGVVIPAGGTLYVSPNVNAFRARQTGPSGGQSLFVQGNYSGRISNLGETIELVATDGTAVATVTTPAEPSLGRPISGSARSCTIRTIRRRAAAFRDDDDFEFVEVVNTSERCDHRPVGRGADPRHRIHVSCGVPGPRRICAVVRNEAAFVEHYGVEPVVLDEYGGVPAYYWLSNGGESLGLVDADGVVIQHFTYRDNWYSSTDGGGYSLEIVDPLAVDLDLWGQKDGWLASGEIGGTPGRGRTSAVLAVASGDVGCESAAGAKGGLLKARPVCRSPTPLATCGCRGPRKILRVRTNVGSWTEQTHCPGDDRGLVCD